MSRIGKKPIEIPKDVKAEITMSEGCTQVKISGPKGELAQSIPSEIKVEINEGKIFVFPKKDEAKKLSKKSKELWGLYRALISNMVIGAGKGFEKKLEIEGIGFKANVEGDNLVLNLGFTNPVKIKKIPGISFLVEKNVVTVSGYDKEKVGHIAALIRKQKKTEPYKGKGIKYQGEKVRRKEGKKVIATTK